MRGKREFKNRNDINNKIIIIVIAYNEDQAAVKIQSLWKARVLLLLFSIFYIRIFEMK